MPHFDANGNEEWICQVGAHICTGDSTWINGLGNVCNRCLPRVRYQEVQIIARELRKGMVVVSPTTGAKRTLRTDAQATYKGYVRAETDKGETINVHGTTQITIEKVAGIRPANTLLSLHEHCRRESGLEGAALERYIQRHYGHN